MILISNAELQYACLDIESNIILMNQNFFITQISDVRVRKMIISILIRDLNISKYMFDEYVIMNIHFSEINKNKNSVMIKIIRETHLIDNLKVNIIIKNNCIESKEIAVNNVKKTVYIDSCDVIVVADIKISRIIIQTSVYSRKTVVISSQFEIIISIHYIIISDNRDFLFESIDQLNLILYAHLIDA